MPDINDILSNSGIIKELISVNNWLDYLKESKDYLPEISMPWFGMDIGGTLCKLVYFEPSYVSEDEANTEAEALQNIKRYLMKNEAYGENGTRDVDLQVEDVTVGNKKGTIHFINFPTSEMDKFLELAKSKGLASLVTTVSATGGGAFKFENAIKKAVNMKLDKYDELDSLVKGMLFLAVNNPRECYYIEDSKDHRHYQQVPYDFRDPFPFIIVNIGSGVSILSVRSPTDYKRICGSSLGGGTFLGLCYLLTGCDSFEQAMDLATLGSNQGVDKLVKDIYGGDYERFHLGGNLVASSFGQMTHKGKREKASIQDLARTTLVTITNNIGSIARMCALNEGIHKVVFAGNFLRNNPIAMTLLSDAMTYWSNGILKALFLKHEGYFGAIGCLLSSNELDKKDRITQSYSEMDEKADGCITLHKENNTDELNSTANEVDLSKTLPLQSGGDKND